MRIEEPFPQPVVYKQQRRRTKPAIIALWIVAGILGSTVGISGWQAFASRLGTELAVVNSSQSMGNLQRLQDEVGKKPRQTDHLLGQSDMPYTIESIKRDLHDPVGRSDPFSPLVRPIIANPTLSSTGLPAPKRDILLDLQYTGFIGDSSSRNKVAVIRVNDPISGSKTLIKKAGESFTVEGQRAVLTSISTNGITVRLSGESRSLNLQPYQEIPVADASGGPTNNNLVPASLGVNAGATAAIGMPNGAIPPAIPALSTPAVYPGNSIEIPRGR